MDKIDFFQYCELVNYLNEMTKLYEDGISPISDTTYDKEYKKLKDFEKENPDLILPNSPTRIISTNTKNSGFRKIEHKYPMLSIANINSHDELYEWVDELINKGIYDYVLEFKFDGVSLSLRYVNGELTNAVTRGDGNIGDDVIENAIHVNGVLNRIPNFNLVEIRGEVIWFNDDFISFNMEQERLGKKVFTNPRNGASGTLKLHDVNEVIKRKLSFIPYRIVDGFNTNLHSEDLEILGKLGFKLAPYYVFTDIRNSSDIQKIIEKVDEMKVERDKLPYITDGLVIKVNNKNEYQRLGGTSKCPRAFGAYKFPPEIKSTKCIDVIASYGKSGIVTPVAIFEPIVLSSTTVRKSTVHNWDMLEYLGLYKGCEINVRKSGEIIPQVISVVGFEHNNRDEYEKIMCKKDGRYIINEEIKKLHASHPNLEFYKRPTHCIYCKSDLVQNVSENGDFLVSLMCYNENCKSRILNKLIYFVSKNGMNILNIGDAIVEELLNNGIIEDFTSFYNLTKNQLMQICGEKESEKIIDNINKSKNNTLNKLLCAFSIEGVGEIASLEISKRYESLEKIKYIILNEPEDLINVPKLGKKSANAMIKWFKNNIKIVDYFIINKIACFSKKELIKSNKFNGLVFIMTGVSDILDRNDFKKHVIENGGRVSSSITNKVNFVVLGNNPGKSKLNAIKVLQENGSQIKIISDVDFLNMVNIV